MPKRHWNTRTLLTSSFIDLGEIRGAWQPRLPRIQHTKTCIRGTIWGRPCGRYGRPAGLERLEGGHFPDSVLETLAALASGKNQPQFTASVNVTL